MPLQVPNQFRVRRGEFGSTDADGNNGLFYVKLKHGQSVKVIASDGEGWEHVSVSRADRTPTWDEMCQVKALFWSEDDCVVQYHPPKSDYVSNHNFCLHMWRPIGIDFPRPPTMMVGIPGFTLV